MKTAKYFTATWCGPCKAFKPVMNEVAGEGHSIQFVDIDENQSLASQYGIRSVPTTIIEENGEWHQIMYDKYKNNPNVKKDVLENLRKKTSDKHWIYRWTGLRKYVPHNNPIYKRHLLSSSQYKCNK